MRGAPLILCCVSSIVAFSTILPDVGADEPPAQETPYDRSIEQIDREHWAYQPVADVVVPHVRDAGWSRNPVDNFILARLEEQGWQPASPVDRRRLLRRVSLDLIGLPPDPALQRRFLSDSAPDAYERLVDSLLADPGYGERWGRHWLDLVRFAETNGYERDAIKPHAWRYRDYVIDAFNADKPYDRFAIEQLAGDEISGDTAETVIATGYYRLGPWDDEPADPAQDRFDQLDDLVRTTSGVFLGLTLGCARCHNHKFDALSMRDYYRMAAIFAPLDRPRQGRTELDRPAGSREQLETLAACDRRIAEIETEIEQVRQQYRAEYLASDRSRLAPDVLLAFRTEPENRSPAQQELVKKNAGQLEAEVTAALPDVAREQIAARQSEIAQLRKRMPALPRGYFMIEPSPTAPETFILHKGRAAALGPRVDPGVPAVLVSDQPEFLEPDEFTSRRRLTLARWIASRDNPLTARVIVNRVWQYHFGAGLVRTPSDFGVMNAGPTHPELLDWLADWFVHEADWSLKRLHRLIVTSSTFRMSKSWNAQYAAEDPENTLLWRFPYRRLEVEAIRDSMMAASGRLNRTMHGPSSYLSVPPQALEGHSDPDKIWKPLDEPSASRRTVYAFIKRSLVVPMLEVLDLCDTTRSVEQRNVTSVAPQALTLLNGEFVNRQARHLADRLTHDAPKDPRTQIQRAYALVLCRPANEDETAGLQEFLIRESAALHAEAAKAGTPLSKQQSHRQALIRMSRVLLNLNEFVYPD